MATVHSQSHPDHQALKAFYISTNGTNWTDKTGWETGIDDPNANPCDGWKSVYCTDNRVSSIIMTQNGLTGSISPEIGQLEKLRSLFLGFNDISGELPITISSLANLEQLNLYSNQLEGDIPSSIVELGKLHDLDLGNNKYSGPIPKFLSEIPILRSLNLTYNAFSGTIPTEFAQISSLNSLNLAHNNLTGTIPPEFAFLDGLYYLYLHNNELEGDISGVFENMDELLAVNLSNNNFTGKITSELMASPEIMRIDLKNNKFTGQIPAGFGDLNELIKFNLGNNNFKGCIPQDLKNLCSKEVELSGNFLLPWTGNFFSFCETNGYPNGQYNAPCNDGINANGTDDLIHNDCSCGESSLAAIDPGLDVQLLYPNPTSGNAFIEVEENKTFTIYDFTGALIDNGRLSKGINEVLIPDNAGVYFLRISNGEHSTIQRVIVQ